MCLGRSTQLRMRSPQFRRTAHRHEDASSSPRRQSGSDSSANNSGIWPAFYLLLTLMAISFGQLGKDVRIKTESCRGLRAGLPGEVAGPNGRFVDELGNAGVEVSRS